MNKKRIALWAVATLLAIVFTLVGLSKITGPSALGWAKRFSGWGYPAGTSFAVGVVEMVIAMGLLIPAVRRSASIVLIFVMMGAAITHVLHGEFARVIPPTIFSALAAFLQSEGSSNKSARS